MRSQAIISLAIRNILRYDLYMATTEIADKKQIAVRVAPELWRRIRQLAVQRDTSASEVASNMLEKYINKEERLA